MDMIEYINWVYEHGIKPAKPKMEDNKEISNFDVTMSNLMQMKK